MWVQGKSQTLMESWPDFLQTLLKESSTTR